MIAARRFRVTGHGAVDVCAFFNRFTVTAIGEAITERAVKLRGERKLKLPDAIILATAIESGRMLMTRNTSDFGDTLPACSPSVPGLILDAIIHSRAKNRSIASRDL